MLNEEKYLLPAVLFEPGYNSIDKIRPPTTSSFVFASYLKANKFVRTKMRLKLGTKIDLSWRFVRFCQICQICRFRFVKFVRFANFRNLKKRETDQRTDGQTLL